MFKHLLPFFLLIPAWSQTTPVTPPTPPTPPECLTRPVTQGSVTITCSLIDNFFANSAADNGIVIAPNGSFLFQVRVVSSDPATIGARIGVSYLSLESAPETKPATQWGVTGLTATANNVVAIPGFRYTFYISGSIISSIQVEELKASSVQTF
jgi:hypothetical protein